MNLSETLNHFAWAFKTSGLIENIFGSLIFLVIAFILIKPSVIIGDYMAQVPQTNSSEEHLRFKIVNCSLFKAYDLKIHIYEMRRMSVSGSDVKSTLLGSYVGIREGTPYLQSALISAFEETKINAVQVRVNKLVAKEGTLLAALSSNESFVEVHVSLRHGLSGLQGNFIKRYHNSTVIKSGFFAHGFSTAIKS